MATAKKVHQNYPAHAKKGPRRAATLRGPNLCLLALAAPAKPLVHAVNNYARCDRHEKIHQNIHPTHLLPVARLEKGSTNSILVFDKDGKGKLRKKGRGRISTRICRKPLQKLERYCTMKVQTNQSYLEDEYYDFCRRIPQWRHL